MMSNTKIALSDKAECKAGYLKGDAHFSREICLRRRKNLDLSPLTQRFVEILRRVVADNPMEPISPKRASRARRAAHGQ